LTLVATILLWFAMFGACCGISQLRKPLVLFQPFLCLSINHTLFLEKPTPFRICNAIVIQVQYKKTWL
jgi:hypothetical protein